MRMHYVIEWNAMTFGSKYAGKWVAVKGSKVVGSDESFSALRKRVHKRKDRKLISFDLIPKGFLTGSF